jgi:chromosome partitioning protein
MRRVIFNQKGGVGKSSIAVNLAAISAVRGLRTLVVDLDPQGNATQYLLGTSGDGVATTLADYFEQVLAFRLLPRPPEDFVVATPFDDLFLLASSPALTDLQGKLEARYKIYKLREALDALGNAFAAVYIDTPPAFNVYTLSALIAADTCLIPFDCDEFARRALYRLIENAEETRADHNEDLDVEGIIINRFKSTANLPRRVVDALRAEGMPVLQTLLPSSVKMQESHEQARPLIYLAPRHKLTQRFCALFDELHAD